MMIDRRRIERLAAVDLNLVVVLHHLLATESVTLAAQRVRLTQPAVSNALAKLRDLLGDQILVRSGRGLVMTPLAASLKPDVDEVIERLSALFEGKRAFDPRLCDARFTLACGDDSQLGDLPRLVAALGREMPKARLRVVTLDFLLARDGLATGEVDLALGPPNAAPPGCHVAVVRRESAVLVVRRGHPASKRRKKAQAFADVARVETRLTLGEPGIVHREHQARIASRGARIDYAVAVPSFAAAAMVVLESDMAVGMPESAARSLAERLPLSIVPYPEGANLITTAMLWHERTHRDVEHKAFRALVKEVMASSRIES